MSMKLMVTLNQNVVFNRTSDELYGLVVKISAFHVEGSGSIPGRGANPNGYARHA